MISYQFLLFIATEMNDISTIMNDIYMYVYICIYIYVCVCVCVYVTEFVKRGLIHASDLVTL